MTFMYLRNIGRKPDTHLPSEGLGTLEDRGTMGFPTGYEYERSYGVWTPHIVMREVRGVTLYEGLPVLPDDGPLQRSSAT